MKEFLDINTTSEVNEALNSPDEFLELDALFSKARQDRPVLADENFTKFVVNSLPSKATRRPERGFSFDIIGVCLGMILAYFYFDVSQLLSKLINIVPETITLSLMHAIVAIGSVTVMSVAAWWTVEKGRSL